MEPTSEALLAFQGLNGIDGPCHVRVYERPGVLPVVIAGELEDNPGTMLDNGIEMVAAVIQRVLFADGREFRLVRYAPPGRRYGGPGFSLVEFHHRTLEENPADSALYTGQILLENDEGDALRLRGEPKRGSFRDPSWTMIPDIGPFVGCEVEIHPDGEYTASALFGPDGEKQRAEFAANARATAETLIELLRDEPQ